MTNPSFPYPFFLCVLIVCYFISAGATEHIPSKEIKKAEDFEKVHSYEQAEKIWENLTKNEPENAYYLYRLGRLYAWTGRYFEAEKLLQRALEINPKDADVQLALAYLYFWTDRKDQARKQFTMILQNFPKYEDAKKGLIKLDESDREEFKQFKSKIEIAEKNLALFFPANLKEIEEKTSQHADALEKEKAYKEAEVIWSYLLKQEPNNAYYLYKLGRIFAWTKRYDEAEKLLNRSLELNTKDADAQLSLAYLYFWTDREEKAKALFNHILKEHPQYEDAKKGLEKIEESIREKEKERIEKEKNEKEVQDEGKKEDKTDEFEPWQSYWINRAQCLEARKCYDDALCIWCFLLNTCHEISLESYHIHQPSRDIERCILQAGLQCSQRHCLEKEEKKIIERHKAFAFHIGQILSWQGKWERATYFLTYVLSIDDQYDQAWLRLGYVALFSGQYHWARQIFWQLLCKDVKKPDPDTVEAFARASQALIDNFSARRGYYLRIHQPKPIYLDFKQYSLVLKWTNPWLKGVVLYAQERETDLITKVRSAQRNTFFGSIAHYCPINDQSRFFVSGYAGTEREINLVAGKDNFSVLEWKYGIGYDRLLNPWLTLRTWCDIKEGRDLGHPIFPLGSRRRLEPGGIFSYSNPNCNASISAIRDSFIVKRFANSISTFLPRDTYTGQIEYGHFNNWIYTGMLGFYCFYHDTPLNRQWEGQGWVTIGYPRYEPCLFVQYRGRVSGFKSVQTDYYSYARQWEHFAKVYFLKETRFNTELEMGYQRSWQWSRDLNQPINTVIFVRRLFRITNKAFFEVRHLYRPNINLIFRSEYYTDTTEYTAWLTKGEIQLAF